MEKRIPYMHYQQVKSVAKAIDQPLRQKAKIQAQIDALDEEFIKKGEEALVKLKAKLKEDKAKALETLKAALETKEKEISLFEAGVFNIIGVHVTDLVKKVIEPTGKTDAEGKPIKVTKYLPTDIVRYDAETREYVITLPDEEAETVTPPTTEDVAGSDYDKDAEQFLNTEEAESPLIPEEGEAVPEVVDGPADGPETKGEGLPWD